MSRIWICDIWKSLYYLFIILHFILHTFFLGGGGGKYLAWEKERDAMQQKVHKNKSRENQLASTCHIIKLFAHYQGCQVHAQTNV